jgi:hypothetical protein
MFNSTGPGSEKIAKMVDTKVDSLWFLNYFEIILEVIFEIIFI